MAHYIGVGVEQLFCHFAKEPYSWTPEVIGRLTIPQIKMYLRDGQRRKFRSLAEFAEYKRRMREGEE